MELGGLDATAWNAVVVRPRSGNPERDVLRNAITVGHRDGLGKGT